MSTIAKCATVLAFWIVAAIAPLGAHADALDEAEQALLGRWVLPAVNNDDRTVRVLEILALRSEGQGIIADGFYGGYGIMNPVSIPLSISRGNYALQFSTPGVRADLKTTAADRMSGTLTTPDGKSRPVTFEAVPIETVFAPGTTPSLEQMEELLFGSWLLRVSKSQTPASFEIREILAEGAGFHGNALFGRADGTPRPTPVKIRLKNGTVGIDYVSVAGAHIRARLLSPDRMEGVITLPDGKSLLATFTTSNEIANLAAVAARPGSKGIAPQTLSVIYIGAYNCPACQTYSSRSESNGARFSMKALKTATEQKGAKFHGLTFGSYTNTLEDSIWPPEVRWVRQKTYAAGGTPRFLLVGEDRVFVNVQGAFKVPSLLQKLDELIAPKGAGQLKR